MKPFVATLVASGVGRGARRAALVGRREASVAMRRRRACRRSRPGRHRGRRVRTGIPAASAQPWPADLDSHFRFLSGIFLAMGIAWYSCIPAIEANVARFRLLAVADVCRRPGAVVFARHRRSAVDRPSRRSRRRTGRGAVAGAVAGQGCTALSCRFGAREVERCRQRSRTPGFQWRNPCDAPILALTICASRQGTHFPGALLIPRELSLEGPVGSFIWRPPTL